MNPQDLSPLASSLASDIKYCFDGSNIEVESPSSFVLRLPKDINEISLDGAPLPPFRDSRFVIPAGEHSITMMPQTASTFSMHELQTRVMSATGNLLSLSYGLRDVTFEYESDIRMLISLSNVPTSITIDGQPFEYGVMKGNDCFSVFLPTGRHTANIVTAGRFAYGVNITSFWSTTAIAIFSALAISLLFLMYIFLKISRSVSALRKA
jgi:hypothetical protein